MHFTNAHGAGQRPHSCDDADYLRRRQADGAACLAAALDYLKLGWSALALCPPDHVGVGKTHAQKCRFPGKAPWGNWLDFQDRLPTEDELRRKWRDNRTLNVGAAAGPVSGWIRVDVEGALGQAKLLELSGGTVPPTPEFRSGRSDATGRGLLFGIPDGVILRTTTQSFAVHDELRFQAKGAQTVLPPSRHKDGGLYEWLPGRSPFDIPLAPMPEWMVRLMRVEPATGGASAEPGDVNLAEVLSALAGFPNTGVDYDTWLAVGMILHSVSDSDLLRDEWVRWSERSGKHVAGVCEVKWLSFGKREPGIDPVTGRPRTVGPATLFKWAKQATGWYYGPRVKLTKAGANGTAHGAAAGDSEPPDLHDSPTGGHGMNRPKALANFVWLDVPAPDGEEEGQKKAKKRRVGLSAEHVCADLMALSGGWPRRVGPALFVRDGDRGPLWLTKVTDLFAWTQSLFPDRDLNAIEWAERTPGLVSRSEFDAYLRQQVTRYESVESAPHEPAIAGHYYIHPPVEGGDGRALAGLLSRFTPHTEDDALLLKAFYLTLYWGGPYGHRPAFLFTGPDEDEVMGRGVGKTTAVRLAARPIGGTFDVRPSDNWNDVMKRLLSDTVCSTQRVILIDNVKTHRFSWSDVEALITAERVNGRKLYVGDGARPNTFTVCITLNGASLSKDLAQRCVIVKLDRPAYRGNWETETTAYIDANRWAIVGDILAELRRAPAELSAFSRWGLWERDVLGRLPESERLQALISDRRADVDDDEEEATLIREGLADELKTRGHGDADKCGVRISAKVMAEIVNQSLGERLSTTAVNTKMKALGGAIGELSKKTYVGRRTWVWAGKDWKGTTPEQLRERPIPAGGWR